MPAVLMDLFKKKAAAVQPIVKKVPVFERNLYDSVISADMKAADAAVDIRAPSRMQNDKNKLVYE